MNQWKEEYDKISQASNNGQVTDISQSLTSAIDQIPQLTERKKKIDMHVLLATKLVSEIKRRSIDNLQDYEDELMTTGKVSSANRIEVVNYFKRETDKSEEYNDKLRLLLIYILCANDVNEVKQHIETVKTLHADKFDQAFIDSLLKRRSDFESSVTQT